LRKLDIAPVLGGREKKSTLTGGKRDRRVARKASGSVRVNQWPGGGGLLRGDGKLCVEQKRRRNHDREIPKQGGSKEKKPKTGISRRCPAKNYLDTGKRVVRDGKKNKTSER